MMELGFLLLLLPIFTFSLIPRSVSEQEVSLQLEKNTDAGLLPPPEYVKPVCNKAPCHRTLIKAKVYIEDTLWDRMARFKLDLEDQLEDLLQKGNDKLSDLDDGGFNVYYEENMVKLKNSDIVLGDTYVDRLENNVTKKRDPNNIHSYTFTFQEAVEKLPDRFAVDIRILFILRSGHSNTAGTAEETCICNQNWFGCVAVIAIKWLSNWSHHSSIFAHEIAHSLGMGVHDDMFYESNPDDRLIMWSKVGLQADIWSPEAKKKILKQDNSCLRKEIPPSSIVNAYN